MVVGVAVSFALAGEDAGDDLQCGFVVVGEVDLAEVVAGEASFEGGVGDAFGGEQASVQQFGVEQVQAVGEGVDVGDDVEYAAVVGSVPTAEELREQPCGRREQWQAGQLGRGDRGVGQFACGEVGQQGGSSPTPSARPNCPYTAPVNPRVPRSANLPVTAPTPIEAWRWRACAPPTATTNLRSRSNPRCGKAR